MADDTVDGSEILRSPVEVGSFPSFPIIYQDFSTIPGGFSRRISGCHQFRIYFDSKKNRQVQVLWALVS